MRASRGETAEAPRKPARYADIDESEPPTYIGWTKRYDVYLTREVEVDAGGVKKEIYVDRQSIDPNWAPPGDTRSYERDVRDWHIVYQNMHRGSRAGSLGRRNSTTTAGSGQAQRYRENFSFLLPNPHLPRERVVTIGDVTRILTIGPADKDEDYRLDRLTVGQQLGNTAKNMEYAVRLDLENPYYRNIFKYLTAVEPTHCWSDGIIQGRININTAPSYVIAKLPWMNSNLAQAVVAYRDKLTKPVDYSGVTGRWDRIKSLLDSSLNLNQKDIREEPGFASIGELNFVLGGLWKYRISGREPDGQDLMGFPDLTTNGMGIGDGIIDDFEERDVIFSRISNLAAVRSDLFTAYILVRIGADGPQKRVIAILDRSGVDVSESARASGAVRLVALYPVPDPR